MNRAWQWLPKTGAETKFDLELRTKAVAQVSWHSGILAVGSRALRGSWYSIPSLLTLVRMHLILVYCPRVVDHCEDPGVLTYGSWPLRECTMDLRRRHSHQQVLPRPNWWRIPPYFLANGGEIGGGLRPILCMVGPPSCSTSSSSPAVSCCTAVVL